MNRDDPRYNERLRERVRELHRARYSVRAIADELGISSTRVQQIKNELRLGSIPAKRLAKTARKPKEDAA